MKAIEVDLYDFLMSHRCRFIGIDGAKGKGKTTALTWMQKVLYQFNHTYEKARLIEDAAALNNMGFTEVKPLPYAIFSNYKNFIYIPTKKELFWQKFKFWFKSLIFQYKKKLSKINSDTTLTPEEKELLINQYTLHPLSILKPFKTQLKHFRVPNPEKPYQHLPYGSWLFWSEAFSKDLNNVDDDVEFDPYMFEALQQQRHNGITIIAETQLLSRSCAWAREFIDVQLYIAKRFDFEDHCELLCYLYEGENIVKKFGFSHRFPISTKRKDKLERSGELDGEDEIKLIKLNIPFDAYNYYNPQEHREKFLRNLVKYSQEQWSEEAKDNNKAAIEKRAQEQWEQDKMEREAKVARQLERKAEKDAVKERMATK